MPKSSRSTSRRKSSTRTKPYRKNGRLPVLEVCLSGCCPTVEHPAVRSR